MVHIKNKIMSIQVGKENIDDSGGGTVFLWFVLFSGFFPSFPLSSDISYLPTRLRG